jgi:hypothetical protein
MKCDCHASESLSANSDILSSIKIFFKKDDTKSQQINISISIGVYKFIIIDNIMLLD